MNHEATVHEHRLNDGGAWYRIVCGCGWANDEDSEHRIYSEEQARRIKNTHIREATRHNNS